MQAWMLAALISAAGMGSGIGAAPSASTRATLPRDLQGVWFDTSAEGKRACRDYLRNGPGQDVEWLIGAVVVTPCLLHAVSEYGEGDFYALERIAPRGPGAWVAHVRVGIDTLPSPEEPGDVATLQLARSPQGLLRWREHAADAALYEAGPYFRCSATAPAGWGVP